MKPTLTDQDFSRAAALLGCDAASVRAVCAVEAPRGGFNPDDTPVTLFEGHKFHKFTGGAHATTDPDLCYPGWTNKFYGKTWQVEQARLNRACALDRDAALRATSWGKFQVMGFNFSACGFDTVQSFVNAMYTSEAAQLEVFCAFVKDAGLVGALKAHDWVAFAKRYNGPGYQANRYDTKLATAYAAAGGGHEVV